jgi:hypothetical protein
MGNVSVVAYNVFIGADASDIEDIDNRVQCIFSILQRSHVGLLLLIFEWVVEELFRRQKDFPCDS